MSVSHTEKLKLARLPEWFPLWAYVAFEEGFSDEEIYEVVKEESRKTLSQQYRDIYETDQSIETQINHQNGPVILEEMSLAIFEKLKETYHELYK